MSQNGTTVVGLDAKSVEAMADKQIAAKLDASDKDTTHLLVELSQESYDAIKEVVDRATERGLESSFDYWLKDAIKAGSTGRLRTWNDRDVVTLFKQASAGNDKAKAKLRKILDGSSK